LILVRVVPLQALRLHLARPPLPAPLLDLFHLVRVFAERRSEFGPHFAGHRNGVAVGGLHLAHPHEHSVLVGAHVKKEALVIHSQRGALWQLRGVLVHAEVVDEFCQSVAELDESLSWKSDGLALRCSQSGPPIYGLSDSQKPSPLVLLQIHVVLSILSHQKLALKRPPGLVLHNIGVAGTQLGVVLDEVSQVVAELHGYRHGESQAALISPGPDLCYLQKAAFGVLLYVQIEAFVLNVNPLRRELLRVVLQPRCCARRARVHWAGAGACGESTVLTSTVSIRH
ncbi:putative transcriptional activator protein Pur-alpha, partial [Triplophysa rosa]